MRGGNDRPAFAFPAIHLAETLKWVKPTSRTPGKCPLCPVSSTGSTQYLAAYKAIPRLFDEVQ
jgi:hypothetical protein